MSGTEGPSCEGFCIVCGDIYVSGRGMLFVRVEYIHIHENTVRNLFAPVRWMSHSTYRGGFEPHRCVPMELCSYVSNAGEMAARVSFVGYGSLHR